MVTGELDIWLGGGAGTGGSGPTVVASQAHSVGDGDVDIFDPIPDDGHTYEVVAEITAAFDGECAWAVHNADNIVVAPFSTLDGGALPTTLRVFGHGFQHVGTGDGFELGEFAVIGYAATFRVPTGGSPQQLSVHEFSGHAATAGTVTFYLRDWGVVFP